MTVDGTHESCVKRGNIFYSFHSANRKEIYRLEVPDLMGKSSPNLPVSPANLTKDF